MHHQNRRLTTLMFTAMTYAGLCQPAAAQSNITVNGTIDTYIGSMRSSGDTAQKTAVNSGGMTTSWIGFNGSEDLGGGMKASFSLSSFLRSDTGEAGRFPGNETLWSRSANVSLSGAFGSIALGQNLAPHFLPMILFNPFGDSYTFSPLNLHADVPLFNASKWSSSDVGDTGWSNQILYSLPSIAGMTVNLHYQFGEVAGDSSKNNVGANLLYAAGPLGLTAFYHKLKVNNPLNTPAGNVQPGGALPLASGQFATSQAAWMVGVRYDFSVATAYATFGQTSHDIDFEDSTVSLGASVPMGGGKLLAAWARTGRSGTAIGASQSRSTVSVGYDYAVSKRTDLYAVVMNDKITHQTSGSSFGIGIRHGF